MSMIKMKVLAENGHTLLTGEGGESCMLVYTAAYQPGDRICIETDTIGIYCMLQLEDALPAALVYLTQKEYNFYIPFGEKKTAYSPKAFSGSRHLITARLAKADEIYTRRNLAFNPYDQNGVEGAYPHATANIETRGEAVFAARNTIDGVFANTSHGEYPYQSWGINRRPDAELSIHFGVPVLADALRLTLRADFPHDNYWVKGTVAFSNGDTMTIALHKTAQPQEFTFAPKVITHITLKDLIPSAEPSPFPALTQVELFGTTAGKEQGDET